MIVQLLLFLILLLLLFFITKKLITALYTIIFFITGNQHISLWILAFFLLPGTIIHELSHWIIAILLRVPAGHITIFPQIDHPSKHAREINVRAGSVKIAKTDPFRHTIIGLAPMLIGLALIYFVGQVFFAEGLKIPTTNDQRLTTILGIYLLFITSTTMFSSKKDLEALLIAGPITILVVASLYFAGVRIFLAENAVEKIAAILIQLNQSLLLTTLINGVIVLVLFLSAAFVRKILR